MSCSPFDLRDYYFKELAGNERRLTEVHVKTCAHCREELDRLRGTEAALLTLPEQEIPQRIGFVSDPVFQRSAWGRGWDALWGSAARLGFASAAMLAVALMVFVFTRPAPPASAPAPASDRAALEADYFRRVNEAVQKAVAASEARQALRTQELLAAAEKRQALDMAAMKARFDQYIEVERKLQNTRILASVNSGAEPGNGDAQ